VEGIETYDAGLGAAVVPIAVVILAGLFLLQRFGTERIGGLFGPVMVVWFAIILVVGVASLIRSPEVLAALSPHWILLLVVEQPWVAFVALGGVVLAITGAEALYADMGHFGRRPIALAWLAVVFPALLCNYLGQGAEVLRSTDAVTDPFWDLIPRWATIPTVVIATMATVIASQAVISGSFSVVHQAGRLGLLPRLRVLHTSDENPRQIYLPAVNVLLAAAVLTWW
jgi:KUP system potassium uptake protein